MVRTRHVGGSILPSNDSRILEAVHTPLGDMQVKVIAEKDTHGLYLNGELVAQHTNGYSCHAVIQRLLRPNGVVRANEQAEYIVACGGWVSERMFPISI